MYPALTLTQQIKGGQKVDKPVMPINSLEFMHLPFPTSSNANHGWKKQLPIKSNGGF